MPLWPDFCQLSVRGGGGGYVGYIRKALKKGYSEHPGLPAVLTTCLRLWTVLYGTCCIFLSTGSYHVRIHIHSTGCCFPRCTTKAFSCTLMESEAPYPHACHQCAKDSNAHCLHVMRWSLDRLYGHLPPAMDTWILERIRSRALRFCMAMPSHLLPLEASPLRELYGGCVPACLHRCQCTRAGAGACVRGCLPRALGRENEGRVSLALWGRCAVAVWQIPFISSSAFVLARNSGGTQIRHPMTSPLPYGSPLPQARASWK